MNINMKHDEIQGALVALNGGKTDLGYEEENAWYSRKPEWAPLVEELKAALRNNQIRGSIMVATDSDVIFAAGAQSREADGGTVSPLTTYEIGSITKMHTAVCVFKLIDAGMLRLDDKVTQFFPAYTKAGAMTVFDLLHMRSGIVDFANDAEAFFGSPELAEALDEGKITDEILLEHLYRLDLRFAPGTEMKYCNTNYVLLAMILEKITGKSYRELVSELVFVPAGMRASSAVTFGDVTSVPEDKAGYMKEFMIARGAGDIHSNVLDLLKFNRAFFRERIVSPAAKAGILNFVEGYGCGWGQTAGYEDFAGHSGATNSYYCLNAVFHASSDRMYLIMLTCWPGNDGEASDETTDETEKAVEADKYSYFQPAVNICKKHFKT